MFSVVKDTEIGVVWMPVANGVTLSVGQLVYRSGDYMTYFPPATDVVTSRPFGVVIGTNNKVPVYDASIKQNVITGVQTRTAQLSRQYFGAEGMWAKGDPIPLVQIAMIGPETILKGTIVSTPTFSPTAVGSNGESLTASGLSIKASYGVVYCRAGANKGIYRVCTSYASNVAGFTTYWPFGLATTDVFAYVNCGLGNGRINVDTYGRNINPTADVTTAGYTVTVESLSLEPNNEYIIFRFA